MGKSAKKAKKKKFVCELHLTYSFVYDPESNEFKDALISFRKNIDPDGSEEAMLVYVAHNTYLNGRPDMIDGIGIVSFHGFVPKEKNLYSGIDVPGGLPLPDIDVVSNGFMK